MIRWTIESRNETHILSPSLLFPLHSSPFAYLLLDDPASSLLINRPVCSHRAFDVYYSRN